MSYQVLARKWRPQTFIDIVGQEHILAALANSFSLGRIHHAYLFSGTRGVGKTTIGRLLAKGLNCHTGITATPCRQCDNCREIEQGRFVDLIEIDAASRTKVEDTRELLDNVQYIPARGRFKVYLIDEVHMLSCYSFNALLKTLEEPPAHVKFLLATTNPQKLPVTILSRCLQFHLKALDVKQIRNHLSYVLQKEQIMAEPHALQMLASAADGSMRDALSLTDQAIATGLGEVSDEAVSLMLGTLNTEQPLALIEALAEADGGAIMATLAQCAARGMDWDNLLVEMLSLLHRLALGQLAPDQLNSEDNPASKLRLRDLARRLPPSDLQLYYQALIIGRKELPFSPDPRIGVEMTLLRALAFRPSAVEKMTTVASMEKKTAEFDENRHCDSSATGASGAKRALTQLKLDNTRRAGANIATPAQDVPKSSSFSSGVNVGKRLITVKKQNTLTAPVSGSWTDWQTTLPSCPQSSWIDIDKEHFRLIYTGSDCNDEKAESDRQDIVLKSEQEASRALFLPSSSSDSPLPDATTQFLQARIALLKWQKIKKTKKCGQAPARQKTTVPSLERPASASERTKQQHDDAGKKEPMKTPRPEVYGWRVTQQPEVASKPVTTTKSLRTALEHAKTSKLALCLAEESLTRDPWAAQVNRLVVPKVAQQLALNAWKEDLAPGKICLHLRASQRHLNSASAQSALCTALSDVFGASIDLTIVEDDNLTMKTPLEWRQEIYEEKLIRAKKAILHDAHIQVLQSFFDAELDEDSIRPV
ncbi:DNA polymerase III subunit gamma/tau [Candidatus Doolittlea endobia]|uniref:DNA polymerase III subunit gamma/tau n=1 Tax=Candidatus Doolittlea endobia TaxID=1778262 RepID=A0A143WUK0_9ENTR|nr:DNA polymerase III subunit gamma/tau [Candidatus Doolittlea endobia]CUX96549.1 DNA polymerase III subunit tau [Candidatus Doolittlea endobia]